MTASMEDMLPFNGLRGVCAMAIFLGHQTDMFLAPLSSKQTVVIGLEYLQAISLFFLLSGIPLARLYSATGKVHTWEGTQQFWRRRCARLIPIYYLTLVLNLLVVLFTCETIDIRAALRSFLGCALFLQSWFVSLISVGGVLWQVAVFVFGYLLYPFISCRLHGWTNRALALVIIALWLLSVFLWLLVVICSPKAEWLQGWWIWHVHCLSRLPHVFAGVLLGELVERKRSDGESADAASWWGGMVDALSFVLLITAIQAPFIQWYYGADGTEMRSYISIGLEALLLPVHAMWLAGIVLAYHPTSEGSYRECWTRRILSFKPLLALGDVSLVLYCLHLVVLFFYAAVYAYVTTGDWHLMPSVYDYTLRVQVPYWHAPLHWVLVVTVSFMVSKHFEAPARARLAGSRNRQESQQEDVLEPETAKLLQVGSGQLNYSGKDAARGLP